MHSSKVVQLIFVESVKQYLTTLTKTSQ